MIHLPFPFVFSSWAFGVKFFWIIVRPHRSHQWCSIVCTPSIDTVDQIDLAQSTSGLSEDVLKLLLEFLLGFEEGVLVGFTHWCFGNVGMGAHVEVVKGACVNILGSGLRKE